MSYNLQDAALDEMYERISEELYPEHKEQAISEFTADRLQSFYLSNPMVMRSAVEALQEAKRLKANQHPAAAVVFCATTIELLLKATLLQPIVYGLVLSTGIADVIVKHAVGETGFDRYRALLARLFQDLANLDLLKVARIGSKTPLIYECQEVQKRRNDIIHKGMPYKEDAADTALNVAVAVYEKIVVPMLWSLGLTVGGHGCIKRRQFT
jgi:hypothetical protein